VPQTITNFGAGDAPITMVGFAGMEQTSANGWFAYQAKYWADALFPNLKPQDWVALVTFDMNHAWKWTSRKNKDEVRAAVYHLMFPGFSESNIFDALLDTVDRLKDVKGKKSRASLGGAASILFPNTHWIRPSNNSARPTSRFLRWAWPKLLRTIRKSIKG